MPYTCSVLDSSNDEEEEDGDNSVLKGMVLFKGPDINDKANDAYMYILDTKTDQPQWSRDNIKNIDINQSKDIYNNLKEHYKRKNIPKDFIGFIGFNKLSKDIQFMIKKKNHLGFNCNQAKKKNTSEMMLFEQQYLEDKNWNSAELCILQELKMRYYEHIEYKGRLWFANTETAVWNKFQITQQNDKKKN